MVKSPCAADEVMGSDLGYVIFILILCTLASQANAPRFSCCCEKGCWLRCTSACEVGEGAAYRFECMSYFLSVLNRHPKVLVSCAC